MGLYSAATADYDWDSGWSILDGLWFNPTNNGYARIAGYTSNGERCGIFCLNCYNAHSSTAWHIGKPTQMDSGILKDL